ncbi:PAS domain-containing protein [Seleniivibrio woodruffii]|uniref:PAS domain S-box-containing protein n=2 Tax=Seleniivibrio woodruffii TaxID=1078050 RepID=A0A4R1KBJ5_9BACT|nr:PAS domain-containing protein [Seleniivibrio woodruffii]TCK61845.1 PAS domain S-box-containing protein [Seleniivibrio woodruffii]TVZ35040.1 PAS domain S-box-containing protein [Seleniivibrio woodruffii]
MNTLISRISVLFRECSFPVYVYLPDSGDFYQVVAGQHEKVPVPVTMRGYLDTEDMYFQSFKKGDNLMSFYFLRSVQEGQRVVVMINSDKNRYNLNAVARSFNSVVVEAQESVRVLRHSRMKMMKLLDGLKMPLFSVSGEYQIINVNKALADFLGIANIPEIIGKKCYEVIHGRTEPCAFCRMAELMTGESVGTQNIRIEKNGGTRHFEHHMFPVYDQTGELNEFGEFMFDITENFQLVQSIEKYKERVKSFQKAEVDKMNEIGDLKKAYKDLEKNYDEVFLKNRKMSKALEKLFSDDNINELLKLRQENKDIKNKLVRSATALKNFQSTLELQQEKYNDLSKRTVYQLERLINTVNKKSVVTDKELGTLLKMVTDEIKSIRRHLKLEAPPEQD